MTIKLGASRRHRWLKQPSPFALTYTDFTVGTLPDWLTFSRASNAWYFNSSGTLTQASSNVARFDYNPASPVYSANNLEKWSQQFSNAYWDNSAGNLVTVTDNTTIAPDGTLTASTLTEVAGTGSPQIHPVTPALTSVTGTNYIMSIYVKNPASGGNRYAQLAFYTAAFGTNGYANFDLQAGTVGTVGAGVTAGISFIGNGWFRIWIAGAATAAGNCGVQILFVTSSSAARAQSFTVTAGSETSLNIWGAQIEQVTSATTPGTYLVTTSAQITPTTSYAPRGLLLEGARTNSIRNNTMQGAVAGTARTTGSSIAISRTASTTAVAVMASHNFSVGDLATISGATGTNASEYNGTFVVSAVVASTSFSYVTSTSRTDSVTGAGVTGKSPGTLPTNFNVGGAVGLVSVVDALGTVNGASYMNLRIAGLSAGAFFTFLFEQSQVITAAQNSIWVHSNYIGVVGGTKTNISALTMAIRSQNAAGVTLADYGPDKLASIGATPSRIQTTQTILDATTAFVRPFMASTHTSGAMIDITFQIFLDQIEAVSSASQVASSPIPTNGSALTRSADIATITGVPATILASGQGTALVETTQYVTSAGVGSRLIAASLNTPLTLAIGSGAVATNDGSVTLSVAGPSAWTAGARGSVGWNSGGRSVVSTGQALVTDSRIGNWSGTFYLGSNNGSLTADGWYSRAAFWNTRRPDAVLTAKCVLGSPL